MSQGFHKGDHVSESDLVDCTQFCPVCTSTAARPAVFRIQSAPDIFLLTCPDCKGSSASRMPTPEYLAYYYERFYANDERRVTFSDDVRFARHILSSIPRDHWGNSVRILDFGGGDGSLSIAISQGLLSERMGRSIELVLVDFQTPAPFSHENLTFSHVRTLEEIEGQYDLVLASSVLEHIPNLNPIFKSLFAATAAGGYFYARTPFVVPFTRIIPKFDLMFPGHVHDLGSSFWNAAVDTYRFKARYIVSGPSIVATNWMKDPVRTLAAYVLKFPAQIEGALSSSARRERLWNLVGGWEVLLQRNQVTRIIDSNERDVTNGGLNQDFAERTLSF